MDEEPTIHLTESEFRSLIAQAVDRGADGALAEVRKYCKALADRINLTEED